MKKLFLIALLILLSVSRAYGWGTTGGDGSSANALQETAVFYNNSDSTIAAGEVVVFDTGASSTLGAYVVRRARADEILVAGVAKAASADSTPVIVVTKGPAEVTINDSSDPVNIDSGVGTTTTMGRAGGGRNLGAPLEAGDGTDGDSIWIWVNPRNAGEAIGAN